MPVYPSAYSVLQSGRATGTQILQVASGLLELTIRDQGRFLRRLILTPFGAARARPHEAFARRSLIGYGHPSMELVAEIFIVIGAMLPGIVTIILEVSSHRLLSALVWTSFSVGLGITATGILMLRRTPMKLFAEIFVVIGAMLPGMATVILEVSLHRPLSVLVGASLSVGSGLIAAGILMLRRQKTYSVGSPEGSRARLQSRLNG